MVLDSRREPLVRALLRYDRSLLEMRVSYDEGRCEVFVVMMNQCH